MRSVTVNSARLREDLSAVVESKELSLSNLQKSYLRSRWMELVLRTNVKYKRALRGHYALRLATVVGCLFILLLVSLGNGTIEGSGYASTRGLTIFFSLFVAGCVAVEQLFNLGDAYRSYERVAGRLEAEGWRFLQLSGSYQSCRNHSDAFAMFAGQVEALSQFDVDAHHFDVVGERKAASPAAEGESPKKLFPLESVELTDSPAAMHSMVNHRSSQQRPQ